MPMHMRRFARLTNGFSKKLENHIAAISLHFFFYYNFVRTQQSLRMNSAMAAGVAVGPMEISDIVRILHQWEASQKVDGESSDGQAVGWNRP